MTPKQLGYRFPAEWEPHRATWLSWPHNEATWPGRISTIYESYCQFVKAIAVGEQVCINVNDLVIRSQAEILLSDAGVDLKKISFFLHPTNDAWCRDHGPAFLVNPRVKHPKVIVDWGYNAWGGKYPPYDADDKIPSLIAAHDGLPCFHPGIIMEGGSVEFNGNGTVLTTRGCLLNPNRNPHLSQQEIEKYLIDYYCVDQVVWLGEGIAGDDTDGHVDDMTRFVNKDTVVTVVEKNHFHPNYQPLLDNLRVLEKMGWNVIELPMPADYMVEGQLLPCSYANFYICNAAVIVPTFNDPYDKIALERLSACFKDRPVIGIDSRALILGLGSFHCLSQQEPV